MQRTLSRVLVTMGHALERSGRATLWLATAFTSFERSAARRNPPMERISNDVIPGTGYLRYQHLFPEGALEDECRRAGLDVIHSADRGSILVLQGSRV